MAKFAAEIVRLALFVVVGILTAAVGELQYSVFIREDWANLFGSIFFNALYLTGAYFVGRLLFRRVANRKAAFLLYVGLGAVVGLMVEWFLIGNSPWGNPQAGQVGMAAYWACMVTVPLIVIDSDRRLRSLKRSIFIYALIYSLLAVGVELLLPDEDWRYAYHIWSVILGYLGLIILCVAGYLRAKNRQQF